MRLSARGRFGPVVRLDANVLFGDMLGDRESDSPETAGNQIHPTIAPRNVVSGRQIDRLERANPPLTTANRDHIVEVIPIDFLNQPFNENRSRHRICRLIHVDGNHADIGEFAGDDAGSSVEQGPCRVGWCLRANAMDTARDD